MFLVEGVSEGLIPNAVKLMPGHAAISLAGTGEHKLSVAVAALLLVAYAAAASAAGWVGTLRRDVK